ncbi:unnamed protein product [Bursaphelenchus okinawaensis]|uniref:G protein-coupled receptor n=1 Tax=Bursaphelenchus okinawaensis TaxID=465554 RepID=A0A811K1A1_9BILA|nr:unnamed protein product [Bursaphelenchus okinawaensis]CAG9088874.1 unnamed protein product [Bursaphelenchus okinawaensis]
MLKASFYLNFIIADPVEFQATVAKLYPWCNNETVPTITFEYKNNAVANANTVTVNVYTAISLSLIVYFAYKTTRVMHDSVLSIRTQKLSGRFTRILFMQALVPFLFHSLPVFLMGRELLPRGVTVGLSQYFVLIIQFCPLFDALIILIALPSFRRKVEEILCFDATNTRTGIGISISTAT